MGGQQNVERAGARCLQVLDAASFCFADNGFHGTSMTELAKAAGMSVGHIYHYFDSKEAIIAAIVERELARQLALFEDLKRQDDVLQALVDRADQGLATRMEPQQMRLRLEILAEVGRNPKIAAVVRAADEAIRTTFREVVEKAVGQGHGLGQGELDARLELVMAVFDGMMVRAVRHPGLDRAAVLAVIRRAIRHILTAAPAATETP